MATKMIGFRFDETDFKRLEAIRAALGGELSKTQVIRRLLRAAKVVPVPEIAVCVEAEDRQRP